MKQAGGNLTLPKAKQSQHVKPEKDHMAKNVGGDAHMQAGDDRGPAVPEMETGGENKKPSKKKGEY